MKRTICILSVLAVLLLAVLAVGKSGVLSRKEETQEGERTLWVITEETVQDGMNSIARRVADQFIEQQGNVTVKLDVLPNSQEERTAYLAQIEKQAEEGNGPDVYLLPINDVLTVEHPEVYTYCRITPLFPDVEQAMHQGKFQDIGPYYEVDSQLEKDALAEKVMDSGIVNGRRYVIPLRYNLPVLYCSQELLQEQNVDTAIFQAGFDRWMENAVEKGDRILACGAEYPSLYVFGEILDYNQKKVLLSTEDVENYFSLFRNVESLVGSQYVHRSAPSLESSILGGVMLYPATVGKLNQAMDYAAISTMEGRQFSMVPVRATSGEIVATVTYYAAVDAQCRTPELAYSFIRQFLSEDAQWDRLRQENTEDSSYGMLEDSWPVRNAGAVPELWKNKKERLAVLEYSSQERYQALEGFELPEKAIEELSMQIDRVQFPSPLARDFRTALYSLNDSQQEGIPTTVSITEAAAQFMEILKARYPDFST